MPCSITLRSILNKFIVEVKCLHNKYFLDKNDVAKDKFTR